MNRNLKRSAARNKKPRSFEHNLSNSIWRRNIESRSGMILAYRRWRYQLFPDAKGRPRYRRIDALGVPGIAISGFPFSPNRMSPEQALAKVHDWLRAQRKIREEIRAAEARLTILNTDVRQREHSLLDGDQQYRVLMSERETIIKNLTQLRRAYFPEFA